MNEPGLRRIAGLVSLLATVIYIFSAVTYKTTPFTTHPIDKAYNQYLAFFLTWTLISMIFLIPGLRLNIEWLKAFLILIGMIYWLALPILFILAPATGTSMDWRISVAFASFPTIISFFSSLLLFAGAPIMTIPSGVLLLASSIYYLKIFLSVGNPGMLNVIMLIFSILMLIISVIEFYIFFLIRKSRIYHLHQD